MQIYKVESPRSKHSLEYRTLEVPVVVFRSFFVGSPTLSSGDHTTTDAIPDTSLKAWDGQRYA
ncbi:hypothetical protein METBISCDRAFT_28941 [Metschnikowia bicuspidata]|uniref:Uncharacterized protein n=1 Tax=Metschnikowia bicuspidata TaxID=27322 RepID=A0A4P9Z7I3_9ASCO|nr:hypothetical protein METBISCDRAFT_28941 [Metschnikowia bicuspidata]